MRTDMFKSPMLHRGLAAAVLLLLSGVSQAQQQVNLTAGPSSAALPDGTSVPMWGYRCGSAVLGSTASCGSTNPAAVGWSPVVITVPTGQDLQINLTNNLTFGTVPNGIPTSIVIVGQLGGGLGDPTQRTTSAPPDHTGAQGSTTWPISGTGAQGTPPLQGARVQSFATEVVPGRTTSLTWKNLRPGTYLIESGTHPSIQAPMGLYGVLVVTNVPTATAAGTAYGTPGTATAISYSAELPLLLSEIDPVQNNAVSAAVATPGFTETAVWSGQASGCGNPSSPTYNTCYPPAVNYSPTYYLFNGVAFDKTHAAASLFPSLPATASGSVLVRLVNAGLRMHVPAIVGATTGSPAIPGLTLVAEDGNPVPGAAHVQNEVFLAAGKTFDVMIAAPAPGVTALPIYDRQLSLSGNSTSRDAGMLAYLSVNGAGLPGSSAIASAIANPDTYNAVVPGRTLTVADAAAGVIANDVNVYGVTLLSSPTQGTLTLNANGTFTYVPNAGWTGSDSFTYQANGTGGPSALVTLAAAPVEPPTGIIVNNITYTSTIATALSIRSPGVLSVDHDAAGYPLAVAAASVTPGAGLTLSVDAGGGFIASVPGPGTYTFTYRAQNSQGTVSAAAATVTLIFPTPSNLLVQVKDGKTGAPIKDYRWIIEEDRTFYIDPATTTNTGGTAVVPTAGTNFHTSYMPIVATGCTGPLSCESGQTVLGVPAVCDLGNGACRTSASQQVAVDPGQVLLDSSRRYYVSVLPGDAANPFNAGNLTPNCGVTTTGASTCGHGMGGAEIAAGQQAVTVLAQATPFPPAKLSIFVFEDDFPLNGEHDAGGGIDILAPNEPGLGSFNITLFDDAGMTGDATGQMTYDMFNQPLSNSLAGTQDPVTGLDACPIARNPRQGANDPAQTGITGVIVTCPRFEADGVTLSPLAGQAVVANMMPGRYGVVATPGADRIARGEEWLQTNTLDGQKAHDSFLRVGEPAYFQEFGPAGYHVSIGFANPTVINSRLKGVCAGTDPILTASNCTNTVKGLITTERMSRTPDERLYSSGTNDSFSFTQCYVSFGDPDGEDFAFTKCNPDGTFSMSGLPDGNWRITVFDQWNDMLVDGLSTPVLLGGGQVTDLGQIGMNQWQANIYTSTFVDANGDGVRQASEPGLQLVPTNIRYRDGSFSNFNSTDLEGNANFNEVFPLFNWYVVETDSTRYKNTGTHVVYDAGGPADGTPCGTSIGTAPCSATALISRFRANTIEQVPLPAPLRVPGAVYCSNADCLGFSIANGPATSASAAAGLSTGRIDPPWVLTEGWQGFSGQNSFLEFGKRPFAAGENGGIHGHVVYASTRPFDDPRLLLQTSWEPLVPGVTINLYRKGTAPDGSPSLTLVDTTKTSSWDDWAQGFRTDGLPNMNCPGQTSADLFYFTIFNQPNYLDAYNAQHGGGTPHTIANNSQFKCYDGMHNWNQLQPASYDGMYQFPSIADRDPLTGAPVGGSGSVAGTNCSICVTSPADGTPMLPRGKYVVEVVVPPNYELVKEEDKNILIGDNYIAPVTVQFPGLGSAVFVMPDQASVAAAYNAKNPANPTQNLGRDGTLPSHEADTGIMESFWPCVGESRIVPDYISLFPQSHEVAPFAGATRPLCDRKEVVLDDQSSVLAKFYVFTSTHAAAHFTGVITDDFTSEFDPFSPQFGEKFSPPNLPISIKDWTGVEVSRIYSDHWGIYNGLTYSTWEVNPPNPTGYAPTMMVTCMNDPGTGAVPDPLFNPAYSQFCYEIPFMPGTTQHMDTPVVPTSGFAGAGYNNPDCAYPDATPAISEVDGDGVGPWVAAPGNTLTINALGDQVAFNNGYSGPAATTAPFNQKTVVRHYGFGSTQGTVTIGGRSAPITGWSDTQITVLVPGGTTATNLPACTIQQQAQYGGPATAAQAARCGELVITNANGKQSVDTVMVTVGGKSPTRIPANGSIQAAIDAAAPGDLIIVPPGTYNEMLLMWKPVRLQGVGAASSVISANAHPAGTLLDPWRAHVNCLFDLGLNGQPLNPGAPITFPPTSSGPIPEIRTNPYDPTGRLSCPAAGWNYYTATPNNSQVDRVPLEATIGWDTTLNGNLAELLQEPSLMGAYEGAGITVLAKGVRYPPLVNTFGIGADTSLGSKVAHEGQMPVPTVVLTSNDCTTSATDPTNPFPSNFQCNPARIDGLSVTNSSQGGGGIFVHGWGHNIEISNNRVQNNTGTLSGGITIGQGEAPDALLAGNGGDPMGYNGGNLAGFDQQPWTCVPGAVAPANTPFGYDEVNIPPGFVLNQQLPYCYNLNVYIHHNAITKNSAIGDELFSSTPAGAGGVTLAIGSDYYKFTNNFVCGNLSSGDGGGVAHMGFSYDGDIEHNQILFNQSTNPTVPANGGGIVIMSAPPDGAPPVPTPQLLECGSVTDVDCAPGLSDGTGPNLVINGNLILGNAAESGSGGGLRLQSVNGTEVGFFPTNPAMWNSVSITNNIIANNVAGWDGAGISLQDALVVDIVNNTIVSNDTTASSGVLFNTLGAPVASSFGPTCTSNCGTASQPQPAGLVTMRNTSLLAASLPATVICAADHGSGGTGTGGLTNGACRTFSVPRIANDVFWQNRSFYIGIGTLGTGSTNQQNVVALYNAFTTTQAASQPSADATAANGNGVVITGGTGACVPSSYWDIGVRGDAGPASHGSGLRLAPAYSILTDAIDYPGAHNAASNPTLVSQYCNGSRTPPELKSMGYQVPPGIADATVPNPIFNLTPAATVDEGNNWINISWGPLALTNSVSGGLLGNYVLAAGSPAINFVPSTATTAAFAPRTDFFGHPRPSVAGGGIDAGAVEFQAGTVPTIGTIAPNFGTRGTSVTVTIVGTNLGGATGLTVSGNGIAVGTLTPINATTLSAVLTIMPYAELTARTVRVETGAGASSAATFTVIAPPAPTLASVTPTTGLRGTVVPVTLVGSNFTALGTTLGVSGDGVSVGSVVVVNPTTVTANLTIAANATASQRTVTVTTPGGSAALAGFTVQGPTLLSVTPNAGAAGTTVPVTIIGTNLTGASALTISGTGVTATSVVATNATTVTASLVIAPGAAATSRTVTVTTPIGITNGLAFQVGTAPTPVTVTPASGVRGTSVNITLSGTSLAGATSLTVSGTGVSVRSFRAVNASTVTATLVIQSNATTGARTLTVRTATGTSTATFTVQGPTLTGISPSTGVRGTSVPITLTGTNLGTATGVTISGTQITVTGFSVVNATTVKATLNIGLTATTGNRSVRVATPIGTPAALTFTVN